MLRTSHQRIRAEPQQSEGQLSPPGDSRANSHRKEESTAPRTRVLTAKSMSKLKPRNETWRLRCIMKMLNIKWSDFITNKDVRDHSKQTPDLEVAPELAGRCFTTSLPNMYLPDVMVDAWRKKEASPGQNELAPDHPARYPMGQELEGPKGDLTPVQGLLLYTKPVDQSTRDKRKLGIGIFEIFAEMLVSKPHLVLFSLCCPSCPMMTLV